MGEKISKRSYYLPDNLVDVFSQWAKPGRDYSTRIAAGIMAILAIEDQDVADRLAKLAFSGQIGYNSQKNRVTGPAVKEAHQILEAHFLDHLIARHIEDLGIEKQDFLLLLMQAKGRSSTSDP
ncbi:MAG TPA: hypothetical protein PLX18_11105 [Anaerohalosphaeraceae bacterium]|nr:hypothetical protein [Anaerohalosphaeraceae bacterium]HQI08388.1 hypothetical protein [Anaerohalosphaeraceae bacterium]